MAPNTTKTGVEALDRAFGGLYLHLPTIICGRRKSGKFVFAAQFLVKALRAGERAIFFTYKCPEDVIAGIDAKDIDINEAISTGQLIICPYSSMRPEGSDPDAALPFPGVMDELSTIVKENGVSYAIFDTVAPWTAIEPVEAMPDHVEHFISTLSALGLTSLLILPEPASPAAQKLATILRELCPINIEFESREFGAQFIIRVTKFQGMAKVNLPMEFSLDLVPGVGFVDIASEETPQIDEITAVAMAKTLEPAPLPTPTPAPTSAFRPFLAPSLASFSRPNASPIAPQPAIQQPAPMMAAPQTAAQQPAVPQPAPQPAPQATAQLASRRASFASVVFLPEFRAPGDSAPGGRPAMRQPGNPL